MGSRGPLFLLHVVIVFVACTFAPFESVAQLDRLTRCPLYGTCVAELSDDPALGVWEYCVEVTWDTGTQHGLSHLDVILALEQCLCICSGFGQVFAARDSAGSSTGEDACTVYYYATFACVDPSVPGLETPLVKYEPYEGECEPGAMGVGTFCFYSDWSPVPIVNTTRLLVIKASGDVCYGDLFGVLPVCSAPSGSGSWNWGGVKAIFR